MVRNQKVIYTAVPKGEPVPGETTKLVTDEIDLDNIPLNGGFLTKNLVVSIDPYQVRGRMRDPSIKSYRPGFVFGEPLDNYGVGEVLRSEHTDIKVGQKLYGFYRFEEYSVFPKESAGSFKILENAERLPWTTWVGAVGMPGKTAWMSLLEIGQPKKGESIFVSAASGAVGQLVCQHAKNLGLRVLASAGTDEKVKFVKNELQVDHAFNYKTSDTAEEIRKFGPVNIFFDNVGGPTLDAVLDGIEDHGRIICCGSISQYNATEKYGVKNTFQIVAKRLKVEGFIVSDLEPKWGEKFYAEVPKKLASGELKFKEDVTVGLENAERAFVGMLRGENFGKAVIKIADT